MCATACVHMHIHESLDSVHGAVVRPAGAVLLKHTSWLAKGRGSAWLGCLVHFPISELSMHANTDVFNSTYMHHDTHARASPTTSL